MVARPICFLVQFGGELAELFSLLNENARQALFVDFARGQVHQVGPVHLDLLHVLADDRYPLLWTGRLLQLLRAVQLGHIGPLLATTLLLLQQGRFTLGLTANRVEAPAGQVLSALDGRLRRRH